MTTLPELPEPCFHIEWDEQGFGRVVDKPTATSAPGWGQRGFDRMRHLLQVENDAWQSAERACEFLQSRVAALEAAASPPTADIRRETEIAHARELVLECMGLDVISGDRTAKKEDRAFVYRTLGTVIGLLAPDPTAPDVSVQQARAERAAVPAVSQFHRGWALAKDGDPNYDQNKAWWGYVQFWYDKAALAAGQPSDAPNS